MNHSPRTSRSISRRHGRRRPGYVLIVVLGLSLVAFSTGIAFIESQGTVLPEAVNRMAAVRARYLSESGIELAMHYLMYPPTTVQYGDYWRGAAQQRIDSSNDHFTVVVQKDDSVEGQYTIRCKGVALYYDGDVRGAHMIRATVLVPPSDSISIPYALLTGESSNIDVGAIIIGDMHTNGDITSYGYCSGAVTCTGNANWMAAAGSVTSGAPGFTVPVANTSEYAYYEIDGTSYAALAYPNSEITTVNATVINSFLDSQPNNPGRILFMTASRVRIDAGVRIRGSLVINGDIEFDGAGTTQVVAAEAFPAVVASGTVSVESDDSVVDITGPVICGSIDMESRQRCNVGVTGTLVAMDTPGVTGADGSNSYLTSTWNESRATYYDLANTDDQRPVTILSWEENYQ